MIDTYVYEERRPLSESVIWQWQRRYYEREGVDAWSSGEVPWFITSNAFIARAYARLLLGYLQDCLARGAIDTAQPVYVVELGAGHGRFAYLLLTRLWELLELQPLAGVDLRYVTTDVAESNLAFQLEHRQFAPYFERGVLDVAAFDCEQDAEIALRRTGARLAPGSVGNPMVVIANYLFDTLRQDAFRVQDGVLEEGLVTVYSEEDERDWTDPAVLERAKLQYEHVPVPADRYPDPALNAILAGYARDLANTSFPFPIGSLDCLERLRAISGDRLLVMSADKGYTQAGDLANYADPQPVAHGSFSMSVNYHAIGEYFRHHGGTALLTTPRDASLSAAAFLIGGERPYPATALAFHEHIERCGPIDFFAMQNALVRLADELTLADALAFMRMADYDPRLFYHLSDRLLAVVDDATEEQQRELRAAMTHVWHGYFALGETQDLPFELGRLYGRMDHYRDALRFYQHSLDLFGQDRATHHNMGLAHYSLGELEESLDSFERALELEPSNSSTRSWRLRLRAELGR